MHVQPKSISELLDIRQQVQDTAPLIHCITNPISINDCANVILAVGAKPIMAEHPREVSEITAAAQAVALNLGNITDARMESMLLSGRTAKKQQIPSILDLVGIACSSLRLDYAKHLIAECRPSVIKGNFSEIKALCGVPNASVGVDAGTYDRITLGTAPQAGSLLKQLSAQTGAVAMATGEVDLISDGTLLCGISNGCSRMSLVTGTGCMLTALTAAFLSQGDAFGSAVLAAAMLGIAGELSQEVPGAGSFHIALLDHLSCLSNHVILERIHNTYFEWKRKQPK